MSDLKLGLGLGYWPAQPPADAVPLAQEAERLGYNSVWTAEAYGSDVFSPLCWIGAQTSRIKLGTGIAQISARSPAALAMTALTIDHLSNGRMILGIGVSGPQVVEGWYGQPFAKPLARTREYVEIIRKIIRREEPATSEGEHYRLPYAGAGATGLGKPLKSIVHPLRKDIPIVIAAEGPRNIALTAEIADGWMPIFLSPYRADVYADSLKDFPPGFEIPCVVSIVVNEDVKQALLPTKFALAFYIGGMGAPEVNFHLNVIARMGFEEETRLVQKLFLEGRREEAVNAVPDELADEISLAGSPDRIRERLKPWIESSVTELIAGTRDPAALKLLADSLR